MKLSENFTLEELIHSNTAERMGIDNVPKDEKVVENLRSLCLEVLQPLRDYVGAPVHINSGYRCPELNMAVDGVKNSQHCRGEAADIQIVSPKHGRRGSRTTADSTRCCWSGIRTGRCGCMCRARETLRKTDRVLKF